MALARRISKEHLAGKHVVELGCGLGLPSMLALARGARVIATDHYQAALDFTRHNARYNLGLEPETRLLDWHTPTTKGLGLFDLVLAADVLYEPRNVPALVALIPTLLATGGEALLADPRRKHTPTFLERLREKGFESLTQEDVVSSDGRKIRVLIHWLRQWESPGILSD